MEKYIYFFKLLNLALPWWSSVYESNEMYFQVQLNILLSRVLLLLLQTLTLTILLFLVKKTSI